MECNKQAKPDKRTRFLFVSHWLVSEFLSTLPELVSFFFSLSYLNSPHAPYFLPFFVFFTCIADWPTRVLDYLVSFYAV